MSDEKREFKIYSETVSYEIPDKIKRIIELLDERERENAERYWAEFVEVLMR